MHIIPQPLTKLPGTPSAAQYAIATRVGSNDTTYTAPMCLDDALDAYERWKAHYCATGKYELRSLPTWFVVEDTARRSRKFVASVALVEVAET